MSKDVSVAVVGATGVVGREVLDILEERGFPVGSLRLMASGRSAGQKIAFLGREIEVENLATADFEGVDLVLSSSGASVSMEFAPRAVSAGAVVIDKSSAYRMVPDVPLVVPEVNPSAVKAHKGIISSPNCSTIPLVVVLAPLHREFGIKRVVVSTYQAVSGAGRKGGDELVGQYVAALARRPMEIDVFPHQMAFNVLPHVERFEKADGGYSTEEVKVREESRKIMGLPGLRLSATCVRVPVLNSHSESVNIEFEREVTADAVREILSNSAGVEIVDNPGEAEYPMPLDATGRDSVLVGRIRRDESVDHGIALWLSADNLRKGAALNAVQIAELLFAD